MAQSAQQIVTLAVQMAGTPGYVAQAGQLLNIILQDLCQTYDFDVARGVAIVNLIVDSPAGSGSGPYPLPADYLRADYGEVYFTYNGVKYELVPIDLGQYDKLVQQPGNSSYPSMYATDLSLQVNATPVMYVWPPSSSAFPLTVRYRRQMPDIATPETSLTVPWFPAQGYLVTRLAGELMKVADDARWESFLGDGPSGAQGILDRYLKLKDDKSNRSISVKLDRRFFGNQWANAKNTKTLGF